MTESTHYSAVPSRGIVTHWMLEEISVSFDNIVLSLD